MAADDPTPELSETPSMGDRLTDFTLKAADGFGRVAGDVLDGLLERIGGLVGLGGGSSGANLAASGGRSGGGSLGDGQFTPPSTPTVRIAPPDTPQIAQAKGREAMASLPDIVQQSVESIKANFQLAMDYNVTRADLGDMPNPLPNKGMERATGIGINA